MRFLLKRLFGFIRDDAGSIAGTFALSFIPLVAMVGAAIDFGQLTDQRSAMKQAADATALALTSSATTSTAAQLQTAGDSYFRANFLGNVSNLTVTATYDSTASAVTVSAAADVGMSVLQAVSVSSMHTSVASTATFGSSRLRVALVLDNTGSMADDGKMTALKTATTNLLTQLQSAGSNSNDVYVSIVPFNVDVNVGSSNSSAAWIDWSGWNANNGSCYSSSWGWGWSWGGYTQSNCGGAWTASNHSSWNGCIADRTQNYDTTADAPTTTNTATLFPADQYDSCPLQLMGLNNNFTTMKTLVNSMTPNGSTNQAIGLAWGWLSLVGGGPFVIPTEDSKYQYQHIVILLSDGLNTQDRWYTNASSIDARQALLCTNAKAAGVTIYAVQVNTGGDPTSTVLQNCASDSNKFTMLTSASQIITTFNAIGTGLNQVRLLN